MTSSVQSHAGSSSRDELAAMVDRGASLADITAHVEALDAQARVDQMRKMGRAQQSKLWEMTKGKSTATMETFVDASEKTIIYEGKNVLPLISTFQKRFYRFASGLVVGYNHNGPMITALSGPGYFVTVQAPEGEILFDYTKRVDTAPPGWPPVAENRGVIAGPVFGGMLDYIRTVSRHMYIGAAFKNGKPRNQYFMITRVPLH